MVIFSHCFLFGEEKNSHVRDCLLGFSRETLSILHNKSEQKVRIVKKINIAHYQTEKKPRGIREQSYPPFKYIFFTKRDFTRN
jgi:hypothetical protein